jgi:hypothetical protein
LFDAKRYVGAGSSWLASTVDGAGQMGNHLEGTSLCRAARGRTPNRRQLAGGDQESDQRPSVHVGRLSMATSGVGVSVRRSTIIVDGLTQSTFMAGEGIRISEPLLRPEAADIGDGRGESEAKAPSGLMDHSGGRDGTKVWRRRRRGQPRRCWSLTGPPYRKHEQGHQIEGGEQLVPVRANRQSSGSKLGGTKVFGGGNPEGVRGEASGRSHLD